MDTQGQEILLVLNYDNRGGGLGMGDWEWGTGDGLGVPTSDCVLVCYLQNDRAGSLRSK